ncbi:MAG: hypothetical protein WCQ50_07465 [Spirochaetota bacterium]
MTQEVGDRSREECDPAAAHPEAALPASRTKLIIRSWFFNRDAEACGQRLSWTAALLCLLLAGTAAAFPFSLGRYREAFALADPARWPGIGAALVEVAARGGGFSVKGGVFLPDSSCPAELSAGGWRIVLDGGEPWTAVPEGRVLRFGKTRITASEPGTKSLLDGPATALEGVTGGELRELARDRGKFTIFVKGFLQALASSEAPGAILAASGLMLLQTAAFVLVLGGFLALSAIGIGGRVASGPRAAGLASSLRTTAALSVGPGLLAALIGSLIPGAGPAFAWLGFSLILGIRVVFVYMGRFKDRARR